MNKNIAYFLLLATVIVACSSIGDIKPSADSKEPTEVGNNIPLAASATADTTTRLDADGCLLPLTTFAFPEGETNIAPPPQEQIPPTNGWKMISNLPISIQPETVSLELSRAHNGVEELWILTSNFQGIYRYDIVNQKWSVKEANETSPYAYGTFLINGKDGKLWAFRKWDSLNTPLISLYNDNSGGFESVLDAGQTFSNLQKMTVNSIKMDANGMFWMILQNHEAGAAISRSLYSFDPSAMKSELQLDVSDFADTLDVSSDSNLLLVNIKDNTLVKFFVASKELKSYVIPVSINSQSLTNLYYDTNGRLWLNDEGFFDFSSVESPQWYSVIRSPVFIDYFAPAQKWNWTSPFFVNEDKKGLLWFKSTRGTGWVDSKIGKWCVVTTGVSNVVKDSTGNLWMLVDGKLYKSEK